MINKIIFIIIVILVILFLTVCCCKIYCFYQNIYITGGIKYYTIREIMETIDLTLVLLNEEGTKALITNIRHLFRNPIIHDDYNKKLDNKRQQEYIDISKVNIQPKMNSLHSILTDQSVIKDRPELSKKFTNLYETYIENRSTINDKVNSIRLFYNNYKEKIKLTSFYNDFVHLIIDEYFDYWRNIYNTRPNGFNTKFKNNIDKFVENLPKSYYQYVKSKLNDQTIKINQNLKNYYNEYKVFKTEIKYISKEILDETNTKPINEKIFDLSTAENTNFKSNLPISGNEIFYLMLIYNKYKLSLTLTILTPNEFNNGSIDKTNQVIKTLHINSFKQLYNKEKKKMVECVKPEYHSMCLSYNKLCYKIVTDSKPDCFNGSLIIRFEYNENNNNYDITYVREGKHRVNERDLRDTNKYTIGVDQWQAGKYIAFQ